MKYGTLRDNLIVYLTVRGYSITALNAKLKKKLYNEISMQQTRTAITDNPHLFEINSDDIVTLKESRLNTNLSTGMYKLIKEQKEKQNDTRRKTT